MSVGLEGEKKIIIYPLIKQSISIWTYLLFKIIFKLAIISNECFSVYMYAIRKFSDVDIFFTVVVKNWSFIPKILN